jgi:8-oxo-dGTP pyrophosphatase MutT (NUDIX family)
MTEVLVPRPASTLMLVRDVPGGGPMEVLMLRRNSRSVWVGGAYVFPGGGVDAEDASPEVASLCTGRTDEEANRVLGLPEGGLGYYVAALRECFEEAGILLAFGDDGPVTFADASVAARFEEHRRRLNGGEVGFREIVEGEGLHLELDRVGYFSHWITPEGAPRRYDTRFFVAVLPAGQEALHDDDEVVASLWVSPSDALARHKAGEIDLMFPTMKNLEAIARFSQAAELIEATAAASVPDILPRLTVEGEGVRIVLPGDPSYESATGLPPGVEFPDRPQEGGRSSAGPPEAGR